MLHYIYIVVTIKAIVCTEDEHTNMDSVYITDNFNRLINNIDKLLFVVVV